MSFIEFRSQTAHGQMGSIDDAFWERTEHTASLNLFIKMAASMDATSSFENVENLTKYDDIRKAYDQLCQEEVDFIYLISSRM